MRRRREANRAEAIIRGIGALVMLILLWFLVHALPGSLLAKKPGDPITGLLTTLALFVALFGAITVLGLVVWLKVLKHPRHQPNNPGNTQSRSPSAAPPLSCADCGAPITPAIANYCHKHLHTPAGKSLCLPCQARYPS
jgi:hypothetical protein